MISIAKNLVLGIYYLIYLAFEVWMTPFLCLMLCLAISLGIKLAQKGKNIGNRSWVTLLVGISILYISVIEMLFRTGGIGNAIKNGGLLWIYYIIINLFVLQISNNIWLDILSLQSKIVDNNIKFYTGIKNVIYILFCISLVPIIAISPYIFARADDYSFGYHCRIAWDMSGSIWEVMKAAVVMIKEAYFGWQGTFSSIFMMAIQPAVFDEKLYAVVPMFFILIITGSSYFFLKTILIDWLKIENTISKICIWVYILLGIQCIPVIQSAFFWYNGAVHYIASHCMQLCLLAFLIRIYIGKGKWSDYLGGIFTAIYVGGGNLVTLVGTLLISLTIVLGIGVTKSWRKNRIIYFICIVFWCAMAINLGAPGNYSRLEAADGMGILQAFVQAFIQSISYLFGEWTHWTGVAAIVFLLPFLWKIAGMIKYSFSYPLVMIGYSWCYLASLFFSPLYGAGRVGAGRYKNVMFLQGILLILFNIVYLMGWMQRKYNLLDKKVFVRNEKGYVSSVIGGIGIALILSYIAEPEHYLTFGSIETLKERESLDEYAEDYWENVEMFTSGENSLTLNRLDNIPKFIEATESEEWYSGTRLFYQFDERNFK